MEKSEIKKFAEKSNAWPFVEARSLRDRLNKIESNLWGFILNKSHKDHLRALAEWEADLAWIQDSKKLWLQEIA